MSNHFIPLSVPNFSGNELKYATEAVKTEWVSTGGQFINDFEKALADYLNVPSAVALQSGTAALHLSLLEAGVTCGDEVIVPTLTFIAAVNPVKYIGAEPIFLDCDDSLGLDPEALELFLINECISKDGVTINKGSKKVIKAIVVVHVFGNLADMEKIINISERYNIPVIEDATEALGTKNNEGRFSGYFAGTIADYGCFSFNGNKIITTGGGGLVVAKNQESLQHIKHLSTQAKEDPVHFIHDEVGFNYRMTNLQAAVGLAQIEQLESFIKTKDENYYLYKELFANNKNIELLPFRENTRSNKWFYALYIKNNPDIKSIIQVLLADNIQTRPIWGLIHLQKPYLKNRNYKINKALQFSSHIINIPCSSNLTSDEVVLVAKRINEITNS